MKPTTSYSQRPFFARPEFLESPPKPFVLPIYIEPVAQAFACQGIRDHISQPKVLNSEALVYLDVEAEESDCEGFSSPHHSTSSFCSESTSTSNSSDDLAKL
jgi:hypothetical protein